MIQVFSDWRPSKIALKILILMVEDLEFCMKLSDNYAIFQITTHHFFVAINVLHVTCSPRKLDNWKRKVFADEH